MVANYFFLLLVLATSNAKLIKYKGRTITKETEIPLHASDVIFDKCTIVELPAGIQNVRKLEYKSCYFFNEDYGVPKNSLLESLQYTDSNVQNFDISTLSSLNLQKLQFKNNLNLSLTCSEEKTIKINSLKLDDHEIKNFQLKKTCLEIKKLDISKTQIDIISNEIFSSFNGITNLVVSKGTKCKEEFTHDVQILVSHKIIPIAYYCKQMMVNKHSTEAPQLVIEVTTLDNVEEIMVPVKLEVNNNTFNKSNNTEVLILSLIGIAIVLLVLITFFGWWIYKKKCSSYKPVAEA